MLHNKTYIILLNWNGWRDTLLCLESLFRQEHGDFVVVVCDNASTDQSLFHLKEWCHGRQEADSGNSELAFLVSPALTKPINFIELDRDEAEAGNGPDCKLVLIQTGANLGFAGGNNVGFRYALARGDADYIWGLNNDTVVPPDSLGCLVEHMQKNPGIGICGSTVRFMMRPEITQALGGGAFNSWNGSGCLLGFNTPYSSMSYEITDRTALSYVFGASMLFSRKFLETVGLMYEGYFLFFEELDLAERAKRHGFTLGYARDSHVFHKAGAATGSGEESAFSIFFLFKSRLKFYRRFYPARLVICYPFLWLDACKALIRGRLNKFKAIASALLGISMFRIPDSQQKQ